SYQCVVLRGYRPPLIYLSVLLPVSIDRLAPGRADYAGPLLRPVLPRLRRLGGGEAETVCLEGARPLRTARCGRDGRGTPHPGRAQDGPGPPRAAVLPHPPGRGVLLPARRGIRQGAAIRHHSVRRDVVRDRVQRGPEEARPPEARGDAHRDHEGRGPPEPQSSGQVHPLLPPERVSGATRLGLLLPVA